MEEHSPLLTMTKSRIIDEAPTLSDEQSMLLETLSGLCAFYSAKDLSSFLFSDKFQSLVGSKEPWIVFEIGAYHDHLKTLEGIPVHDGFTIVDLHATGLISDNIAICNSPDDLTTLISIWYQGVMNK